VSVVMLLRACSRARIRVLAVAVVPAVGLVARLDDVAVVREPVEQRGGHLGVAEHAAHSPKVRLVVIITLVCS
jgi:hypothetical protein